MGVEWGRNRDGMEVDWRSNVGGIRGEMGVEWR